MFLPFITLEEQFAFFDRFPDWSPILDDDARVIGVEGPFNLIIQPPFEKYYVAR